MDGRRLALAQFQQIRADLLCAKVTALHRGQLYACAARGHQLVGKVADALTVVGRLIEGDFE
jgi:hypothetical protein